MSDFIKSILRRDNSRLAGIDPDPGLFGFKVSIPTQVYNNSVETSWNFNIQIPAGYTATATGIINPGYGGGATVDFPILVGSVQLTEGIHQFSINLGNSGQPGVMSTYTGIIEINETGQTKQVLVQRGPTQSAFYDQPPF